MKNICRKTADIYSIKKLDKKDKEKVEPNSFEEKVSQGKPIFYTAEPSAL